SKVIFLYNFRCRTRIAGGFMIRDYVANQSKDNNQNGIYRLIDAVVYSTRDSIKLLILIDTYSTSSSISISISI
ncbi:MAG: hypothetical protein E6268_05885, partial [Veillonella sp.]|uniref:hypothetical protein n=1 Tax=Veillonella sp. TaxID=1926307 RepID=UPI00290F26CE